MHFVLSYDLSAEGNRRTEIEQEIISVINPFRTVHGLSTFYIIHVDNPTQWESIRENLTNIARRIPENFFFIMTPLMSVGRYNGFLPQTLWNDINTLTDLQ